MTRILDIAISALLLCAGAGLFAMTFGDDFDVPTFGGDVGPAFAPRLFLVAWTLLAAAALVNALKSKAEPGDDLKWRQMAWVAIITVSTAYAMTRIGFVFATIPGLALFCWAFQYRRPFPLLVISIAAPMIIWALFTFGFELLLPRSPWFFQI